MALALVECNASAEDINNTAIGESANDTEFTYTDIFAEELAYVLHIYFTPILIFIGVIGNILSIVVFYKSKLRRQSTSQYLSALAVSDTVFLVQLIPPWLKAVKASFVFTRFGFCQLFVYLTYVSSCNSSWLVVAFTVERFVAVIYPLRSRACTVRRARACIACIAVSCLAVNMPVLWFAEARGADCNIVSSMIVLAEWFNFMDTVLSFTVPMVVTVLLNVWIMVGVRRSNRARGCIARDGDMPLREEPLTPPRPCPGRPGLPRRTRSSLQRSKQRVTKMLLLVSSVFVLLNLPAYTMRMVAYAKNLNNYEYSGRWAGLQQICLLFFNANFGINFFLYCLSGQNFRRALFPCAERAIRRSRKLCCCPEDRPLPRPGITNSVSINTEGRSSAAVSCVSAGQECTAAGAWAGTGTGAGAGARCWRRGRTRLDRPYVWLWRFNNSCQTRQHEQVHMQVYNVSNRGPMRPPGIALGSPPNNMNDADVTTPEIENCEKSMFRPIPFNISPGEIAPLGTESMPPSPSLDPSPSPVLSVKRMDVCAVIDTRNGAASPDMISAAQQGVGGKKAAPCSALLAMDSSLSLTPVERIYVCAVAETRNRDISLDKTAAAPQQSDFAPIVIKDDTSPDKTTAALQHSDLAPIVIKNERRLHFAAVVLNDKGLLKRTSLQSPTDSLTVPVNSATSPKLGGGGKGASCTSLIEGQARMARAERGARVFRATM